MNVGSFWKAVQQLLSAAMPNRLIGLTLQHNPILPMIARWTLPDASGLFRRGASQELCRPADRVKSLCGLATSFRNRSSFDEIGLLSPLHGASKMRTRRLSLFLETPETHLCDRNHAHGDARRSVRPAEDEVASRSFIRSS